MVIGDVAGVSVQSQFSVLLRIVWETGEVEVLSRHGGELQ